MTASVASRICLRVEFFLSPARRPCLCLETQITDLSMTMKTTCPKISLQNRASQGSCVESIR